MAALRQIVEDAVDGDSLREVVAGLVAAAKAGDVQAARTLLEHAIGRPRTAPTFVGSPQNELADSDDIAAALRNVVRDVARADVDLEAAEALAGLIEKVANATTWRDLAARVEALESAR